jgi:hypothetical protein
MKKMMDWKALKDTERKLEALNVLFYFYVVTSVVWDYERMPDKKPLPNYENMIDN